MKNLNGLKEINFCYYCTGVSIRNTNWLIVGWVDLNNLPHIKIRSQSKKQKTTKSVESCTVKPNNRSRTEVLSGKLPEVIKDRYGNLGHP